MDIDPIRQGRALSELRLSDLDPTLRRELVEFVKGAEMELSIKSSSRLTFLIRMYDEERARAKEGDGRVKEAETLIFRLAGLHHAREQGVAAQKKEKEDKRRPFRGAGSIEEPISKKVREAFGRIGISDEAVIRGSLEMLGEEKAIWRVELALSTELGEEIVRKVFSSHPILLNIRPDQDDDSEFIKALSRMESNKSRLDIWMAGYKGAVPEGADYDKSPVILTMEPRDLELFLRSSNILDLERKENMKRVLSGEKSLRKFKSVPMGFDDLRNVLGKLGFTYEQRSKEVKWRHEDGATLTTSSKSEYPPQTVRDIITDIATIMKIHPKEAVDAFEKAREEVQGQGRRKSGG